MPDVTVYGVCSWKSFHEKSVLTFRGRDCTSKTPADPPLTAYNAAIALPDDTPLMYAIMSVIDPVAVHVKYEID